jgi:hypothetical protein
MPSMLAISTSPASAGASSSTWAITSSMALVVVESSGLHSSGRRPRLAGATRLLCRLQHDLFYSGGWTEAPLRRLTLRVPIVLFRLIHGVGRCNVLLQLQLSACNASRQVLDYSIQGIYLVRRGL